MTETIELLARLLEESGQDAICDRSFEASVWPQLIEDNVFQECVFDSADFSRCEMRGSTFTDCLFNNCRFNSSQLVEVTFKRCRFYLNEDEISCEFKFAALRDCVFDRCDLTMCLLSRSNLYLTRFLACQMTGIDLSHSSFEHSIGPVDLKDGAFIDCNLAYADLTGANLSEVDFAASRLSHVQMSGTNLAGALLNDCEMHQIEADNVTITGADLRGATISGLDIREIDMTGVRISGWQQEALLAPLGIIVEE